MTKVTSTSYDSLALARYVPASARRILDYGAGDGSRAEALRTRNGAEVVPFAAPSGHELVLPEVSGEFDCVLCDDTIARLRDPKPLLEHFYTLLAPSGFMIVTAPNLQYHENVLMLAAGRWEFRPHGALAHKHIRFFTGYELVRLLQSTGFADARVSVLASDAPKAFPRDAEGCVRRGRITVGPLNDQEYPLWLARDYVVLGQKPAGV